MKTILLFSFILAFSFAEDIITGGWTEQDPVQYLKDAQDNVVFQSAIGASQELVGSDYEFEKIKSIKTQVVSGINTEYVLIFQNKDDHAFKRTVQVIVYYQPWTSLIDIQALKELGI